MRYESGANEPNNDILCKLASFFDVTVDYLLGRDFTEDPQKKELYDILNGMTENQLRQVKEYAEYIAFKR